MATMTSGLYTKRELPTDEWDKLRTIPPYDTLGLPSIQGDWKIFVVENEQGEIIGTTALQVQVHWEPWWVRPDVQKNPAVIRSLLAIGLENMDEYGLPYVFCTVADDQPEIREVVEHLGGIKAPGDLYLIDTQKLAHLKETA